MNKEVKTKFTGGAPTPTASGNDALLLSMTAAFFDTRKGPTAEQRAVFEKIGPHASSPERYAGWVGKHEAYADERPAAPAVKKPGTGMLS